jgi:hypothetical protein
MLTDFTFKDTGIAVKIKKVSPMLATDIYAAIPEPTPPMNEVDYGEPKGKVMEPNLSDPAYQRAMVERAVKVNAAWRRVMILRGVVVDGDDWQNEVKEYRAFIREITGGEIDEDNDLIVYVLRLCVGTGEDLDDLINAITRRSQPTQEAIE